MDFLPVLRQGGRVIRFVLAAFFTGRRPRGTNDGDYISTLVNLFAGATRKGNEYPDI